MPKEVSVTPFNIGQIIIWVQTAQNDTKGFWVKYEKRFKRAQN